jgi:RNA polymerase sigma factor for flagellar operon FliA
MSQQQLLVENLDLVERLVRFVARRHHLSFSDAEEFASVVRLRLVENDFAILRKFEGRSLLSTYLTVVIERLCQDFSIARWGKWRPSAAARRGGEVAVLLERLIVRDGATFDEAVGTLQTNHGVSETRQQLHEILLTLPTRSARWNVHDPAPPPNVDAFTDQSHEDGSEVERVSRALSHAIAALSSEDQRILRLRFEESLTVVEIAAVLDVETRALYRRLQSVIRALRASLEAQGVGHADIPRLVGHPTLLLRSVLAETPQSFPATTPLDVSRRPARHIQPRSR